MYVNNKVTYSSRFWVNNDEDRLLAVFPYQIIDQNIVLMKLRSGVIPANNPLLSIDFLEHVVHTLQVLVVEEPHITVLVVLVERNGETVCYIKHTPKKIMKVCSEYERYR